MFNTPVTITGRVCNDPSYVPKNDNSDGVLRIRVASSRSYMRDEKWHNTDQLFINVEAWGRLAINAHQSLVKGAVVIVQGMLYTNQWELRSEQVAEQDSGKRQEVRLRATSIGVDMSLYRVGFIDSRPRIENASGVPVPVDNSGNYPNIDQPRVEKTASEETDTNSASHEEGTPERELATAGVSSGGYGEDQ